MAKSHDVTILTATAEMAKQMKVFKSGETYVILRASSIYTDHRSSNQTTSSQTVKRTKKPKTTTVSKRVTERPTAKKVKTKNNVKGVVSEKATKKVKKKVIKKKVKATTRKSIKPDLILTFVKKNDGCNMTAIAVATKLPQAAIRRVLNSARDNGSIRTEGQRRGLRYFANAQAGGSADGASDQDQNW
jgi:isochorismate synthase EntC